MEYEVVGLSTNIEFLKRLCRSPAFIEGDVETGFIDKWRDDLFKPRRVENEVFVQAALGLLGSQLRKESNPHGETLGFAEASAFNERNYAFKVQDGYSEQEGGVVEVSITQMGHNLFNARVSRKGDETPQAFDGIVCEVRAESSTTTRLEAVYPLARIESTLVQDPTSEDKLTVFQLGGKTELALVQPQWFEKALGLKETTASVAAPMPCKILRNEVVEGQSVEKGAPLVV